MTDEGRCPRCGGWVWECRHKERPAPNKQYEQTTCRDCDHWENWHVDGTCEVCVGDKGWRGALAEHEYRKGDLFWPGYYPVGRDNERTARIQQVLARHLRPRPCPGSRV